MSLTKKQRDEVVMLLRCAADLIAAGQVDECSAISIASSLLDLSIFDSLDVAGAAYGAEERIFPGSSVTWDRPNRAPRLLETALLVEEGELP